MSQPVRVNVNISGEALAALEQVATARGMTLSAALAQSIGTERFFAQQRAAGNNILVLRNDGSLHKVLPF